jgi:hypothetical protein
VPSGVDNVKEDSSIDEQKIQGADLDVSKDNIIDNDSGERAAKKDINYAEADQVRSNSLANMSCATQADTHSLLRAFQKADEAVESTAGISTQ